MNPTNLLMIFDMDGTLIQSNIDYMGIRDKLRAIIKNIVSSDEYNNIENTIYTILELLNLIKKNDLSGELHQKAWNLLEEYELRGYEKAFVEKDVIKTLERLKNKGHILTLYTNNSNKIAKYALQKYNFNHLFEYVLTRDDVTNSKPNPEGIFTLMERFHKTKTDTTSNTCTKCYNNAQPNDP